MLSCIYIVLAAGLTPIWIRYTCYHHDVWGSLLHTSPDSKIHGANMGPTWVLSAPVGPHVSPMNLAIREVCPALWLAQLCWYHGKQILRSWTICVSEVWNVFCEIRARFLSLTRSKLRLCSANHRAGYFSNRACGWVSIVWAYSE